MDCDKYLELLSARLDGALTEGEERALEAHLSACPDCRAAGAQLAALQGAFPELEDIEAPEGFARGVMDRVRELETEKKVVPLFRRPQFRALAGLAACLVLVIGLYGASQLQNQEKMMLVTRSFQHDVMWDETIDGAGDVSTQESLRGDGDGPQVNAALTDPEAADAPQIAAYAALEADTSAGTAGMERDSTADGLEDTMQKVVPNMAYAQFVLTLDRMPEGGWELIPPETPVSPDGLTVSVELMEQLEQLALEQGIGVSRVVGPEANAHCLIVILDEET